MCERLDLAAAVVAAVAAHVVRPHRLWHCGHTVSDGAEMRVGAPALSRRDFDVFRLGTATAGEYSER